MKRTIFCVLSSLLIMCATAQLSHAETLVLYTALDTAEPAAKAFTKKTGIDVNLVSLSTGELLGKVSAEGNNPQFDILWVEGSAVMSRLAKQGILKSEPGLTTKVDYTDLGTKLVPKSQAFFPISASTTAIEVNTQKLGSASLPTSWADLENFKGSVAAKDPNLSGPAFQWLAGYFQTVGIDKGQSELHKTLTNKALSGIPSGESVNRAVISGDAKIAIQQDSTIYELMDKGEPIKVVYPSEGVTALPSSAGIATASKHEDAAKSFIQFLLSAEGQAAMLTTDGGDGFFAPLIAGIKGKGSRIDNTASWAILDDDMASKNETVWKQWFRDQFVP